MYVAYAHCIMHAVAETSRHCNSDACVLPGLMTTHLRDSWSRNCRPSSSVAILFLGRSYTQSDTKLRDSKTNFLKFREMTAGTVRTADRQETSDMVDMIIRWIVLWKLPGMLPMFLAKVQWKHTNQTVVCNLESLTFCFVSVKYIPVMI